MGGTWFVSDTVHCVFGFLVVGLEARSGFFVFMRGLRVVVSGGQVAMFGVFRFSKALG